MDLMPDVMATDPQVQALQAQLTQEAQQAAQAAAGVQQPVVLPTQADILAAAVQTIKTNRMNAHQALFPLTDNMMAVQIVVMGDMNESQRERFLSFMSIRNIQLEGYTFQIVMEAYRELFCAPKSAIDNPSLRSRGAGGKAFCIVDDGEMDGTQGYWVEDEETGECGFLPEFEDIFWTFDDENFAWMSRPFRGRKLRRVPPKGRGKGKGSKGYSRFK
jgi:hypothetical protein